MVKSFLCIGVIALAFAYTGYAQSSNWVGTWTTSPQLTEERNNPPSPGLSNNTIRQVLRVSIGGDSLRMHFSNEFSPDPVTMKEVHIAISTGGGAINPDTDQVIYFNEETEVTMAANSAVTSDPFYFPIDSLETLAVTIYFGETSPDVTGHPGSRTTSYILEGDAVSQDNFTGSTNTDHWYVINTIDVQASDSAASIAIIGDSITDGRGSGTNKQNRWPDELANRLQQNLETQDVGVLNAGIGGNCVLAACLGPSALSRFDRDVLGQSGIRWLIILEGINDIGSGREGVGEELIDAYKQMIHKAHLNGIYVYGATILPIKGSSYYSETSEAERQIVNKWVRTTDMLDGVIDMDKALRNPADTLALLPAADDGDGLHPSEEGHRLMGEAVDLGFFLDTTPVEYTDNSETFYFEAECGEVGDNWNILVDEEASNRNFVSVKTGTQSLDEAPSGSENLITISFSVDSTGNYSLFGRLNNPTFDDDSFWIQIDGGDFELSNGIVTSGWEWRTLSDYMLTAGDHTLTIGYREDGAGLDKVAISNSEFAPSGMGEEAENLCIRTSSEPKEVSPKGYGLRQNFPNPFNPSTVISYELSKNTFAQLSIFDVSGRKVSELVNEQHIAGSHSVSFNAFGLSSGVYFYQLKTSSGFIESKKMLLLK